MLSKIIGCILLIIGTSIGAGMLALPVATAAGGFYHSLLLFLGAWLVTVIGAFFILEANLWLPENTNLISMAKFTLGPLGQILTWLIYLLLLYSLLSAYIAGGSDLLQGLFKLANWHTAHWLDAVLFVLILGFVVSHGVQAVDFTNRGLMLVKIGAYLLLIILIVPHIQFHRLASGHFHLLAGAIMVVITSFGYATIIPSLRYYFESNINVLRLIIGLGSLCSLIIYIIWDFAVQGSVNSAGPAGLIQMSVSGHAANKLTVALSQVAQSQAIHDLAHVFTSICITTSFLGVALCLSDFLIDGFRVQQNPWGRWLVALFTYLPPLLIVIFYPRTFILGLNFAGIFCVLLLILLPALMVFSGRYVKKVTARYRVHGGMSLVLFEILISCVLLFYGIYYLKI